MCKALLVALSLSACASSERERRGSDARMWAAGSRGPVDAAVDSADASGSGNDAGDASASEEGVCDGSSDLRLAHFGEPVNASSGQVVLLERGGQNLYLDGQCRAWVRAAEWDELRVLNLTDLDARQLSSNLRLSEWRALDASYCVDVVDLGPLAFYFRGKLVVLSGCNTLPAAPFDIWGAMRAEITQLFARGAPIEGGRVRYRLLPFPTNAPDAIRGGEPWPLGDIDDVLADRTADGQPAIQTVDGDAATTLRTLRSRYRSGAIGDYPLFGIPISQPDASQFMLYVRDVSPFEDADGRIAFP